MEEKAPDTERSESTKNFANLFTINGLGLDYATAHLNLQRLNSETDQELTDRCLARWGIQKA